MITFRKIIRLDVKVSVVAVWVGHSALAARPEYDAACWPDGLELTPGFYPGSNELYRLF